VLCEQPSCRGRPECSLYLFVASHRHGLCEGPRVGEDPGVPLSRGCEGGPQAPAVAARCGLAWCWEARRVRTGNVYVRDPLSCVHREFICVHSRVPFAMCVAQGARVWVDPGGGSSAPSRWRTAGCCCQRTAQHREVPGCAHSGRKAPGNDRTLCPRVPGNDQTLCLRGGRAARLLYASLPTRATHEDSLRDSRRGARMLGGEPQGSGVLVLAVARGFSAANLVVSAKCAAAGRPFWRPRDATQARAAAATCCRCSRPGCSSPIRWRLICHVRRVAFFRPPPRAARASGCVRHAGARSGGGAPPSAAPAVLLLSLPR